MNLKNMLRLCQIQVLRMSYEVYQRTKTYKYLIINKIYHMIDK